MTKIFLNRRGIATIEVPDEVEATPGEDLLLRIFNYGSPLHITLASSNSSPYTGFFHENLYVNGPVEFSIPIRENAYPGVFNVEVIAGYGARKAGFRVAVRERAAPEPEPIEIPPIAPTTPSRWRSAAPTLLLVAGALAFYGLWLVHRTDLLNAAAFASLLLGLLLTWLRQRS